jgi:hypothetical protein
MQCGGVLKIHILFMERAKPSRYRLQNEHSRQLDKLFLGGMPQLVEQRSGRVEKIPVMAHS